MIATTATLIEKPIKVPACSVLWPRATSMQSRWRLRHCQVDRLLRGAKVNELPAQFPTKFRLVVNLRAAQTIGLTIPEAFLLRADEVIQ
jgi:ABC transporter substrate binding protein